MPSYASIVSTHLPGFRGRSRPAPARAGGREHLRIGDGAGHRRSGPASAADRFLDVHHRSLVADPMATVRRVYEFLGLELTPAVEQAIARLAAGQPVGAHGAHRYTPGAVRSEHRAAAWPTTTLHPSLRRRRRSERLDQERRQGAKPRLPSWADQMLALAGRRRQRCSRNGGRTARPRPRPRT